MIAPAYDGILAARERVAAAIQFLRSGAPDEFHLIEPSLSFESGALHAIDWILGNPGGAYFEAHLESLRALGKDLRRYGT
jgi:hypothetical protein